MNELTVIGLIFLWVFSMISNTLYMCIMEKPVNLTRMIIVITPGLNTLFIVALILFNIKRIFLSFVNEFKDLKNGL